MGTDAHCRARARTDDNGHIHMKIAYACSLLPVIGGAVRAVRAGGAATCGMMRPGARALDDNERTLRTHI
jgi:hypothetical protein